MSRDASFSSSGLVINGEFHLPADVGDRKVPAIVTANAMTATKDILLPAVSERLVAAGYAVITFDYAHFGASGGEPRQHFIPWQQLEDIKNAISWLELQPEVDASRIGGFGISIGGGHMLQLAAFDRRLKAVVASAASVYALPVWMGMLGKETMQYMLLRSDVARTARMASGAEVEYKTAWGKYGEDVLLPVEEAYDYYMAAKATVAPEYDNRLTVHSGYNMSTYNPDFAVDLAAPTAVMLMHSSQDAIPLSLVESVYERANDPKALRVFEGLHTDLYDTGRHFDESMVAATEWFDLHLAAT